MDAKRRAVGAYANRGDGAHRPFWRVEFLSVSLLAAPLRRPPVTLLRRPPLRWCLDPVRILHLNNEKGWRGGERQVLLLANALKERGVANSIACRPNDFLDQRARELQVPTVPLSGNMVAAAIDLIRAAAGFDLVHCHTGRTHSIAATTARWHRKPVVATRRVDFVPKPTWFNRYKYRSAARVVCVSRHV